MTPIQQQMLELEVRNHALEEVNACLVSQLRLFQACVPQQTRGLLVAAMGNMLREIRARASVPLSLPGLDPAMAGKQAGRRFRAFDEIATAIEDRLQPEPTQAEMKFLGELQQEQARKRSASPE